MGVFSELDMELRQGDSPIAMENLFADRKSVAGESTAADSNPFVDDNPFEQSSNSPISGEQQPAAMAAAPESTALVFEDDARQQAEADAAPAVLAQLNETAEEDPEEPANAESKDAAEEDEDAKRKAHEEAEAKRKAEWDANQAAKKAAMQEQLDRLEAMSDDEVMTASTQRIGADTERLTRRNMKECISEHIQTLCLDDPVFARKAMHPRKSMIHCIWYINRKAQEYAEQEMKDNGIKPDRNGIYGCDVPDGLCYQWAEDYFNDPDAKEDQEEEEKFVPKPYPGGKSSPKPKQKPKKEKPKKEPAKKPAEKAPEKADPDPGQMTLGDFGLLKESA